MKKRYFVVTAGMLAASNAAIAESSAAYKMYVENPEVGQVANTVLVVLACILLFQAIVGWLIGRGKGRGKAGFWWSFFLSWIGWIITACLQPSIEVQAKRARQLKRAMED